MAKVTITDIANELGVSPATVSLVLNDKPGIGDSTRQRVLETAERMGYSFKPSVNLNREQNAKTLGVILRTLEDDALETNRFYAPVLTGIEYICRRHGHKLLYSNMPVDETDHPLALPDMVSDKTVDGILLMGANLTASIHAQLVAQDHPLVLVDAYVAREHLHDALLIDNVAGATAATSHLIANGHTEIAILGSQQNSHPSIIERREGYLHGMQEAGLSPTFFDTPLLPDAVYEQLPAYLEERPNITAIFACNDDVAIAAMRVAGEVGRTVPTHLSIIGFDNISLAQYVSPALTTMRVDKMGMGRQAAQLLINRIDFPTAGTIRAVVYPSLIERDSVTDANNRS